MFKVSITIAGKTKSRKFATIEDARNYAQERHIGRVGYINENIQAWQGEDRTRLNGIAGHFSNRCVAIFVELKSC